MYSSKSTCDVTGVGNNTVLLPRKHKILIKMGTSFCATDLTNRFDKKLLRAISLQNAESKRKEQQMEAAVLCLSHKSCY